MCVVRSCDCLSPSLLSPSSIVRCLCRTPRHYSGRPVFAGLSFTLHAHTRTQHSRVRPRSSPPRLERFSLLPPPAPLVLTTSASLSPEPRTDPETSSSPSPPPPSARRPVRLYAIFHPLHYLSPSLPPFRLVCSVTSCSRRPPCQLRAGDYSPPLSPFHREEWPSCVCACERSNLPISLFVCVCVFASEQSCVSPSILFLCISSLSSFFFLSLRVFTSVRLRQSENNACSISLLVFT